MRTFGQAQQFLAAKHARQVTRRPRTSPRPYVLLGLLFCSVCTRRMQGSWNNDQAYYRCTYPSQYARTNNLRHPRVVYLREAEILPELDTWLSTSLAPVRLPATIEQLAASQDDAIPRELISLREQIGTCDQKLAQYRAALLPGPEPWENGGGRGEPAA
jgi:Recombinase zinc beta ribbon domain